MEQTEIPPIGFKEAVIAENEAEETLDDQFQPTDPLAPDENAPYGYLVDTKTGQRRPKKRAGRGGLPGKTESPPLKFGESPSLEELKRQKAEETEDRSPDSPRKQPGRKGARAKKAAAPVPPFRAGPIASGMNKLYVRVGKIVRAMDYDIGQAIIASTRKEAEDDVTVGEAWEEIARTNPRVRAFLLKILSGSAVSALFMAHAPIFLAILMKEGIRKHIPFGKLIGAVLSDDDDDDGGDPSNISQMLGGLQPGDAEQMMAAAAGMMEQMGLNLPRGAGMPRPPGVAEDAA